MRWIQCYFISCCKVMMEDILLKQTKFTLINGIIITRSAHSTIYWWYVYKLNVKFGSPGSVNYTMATCKISDYQAENWPDQFFFNQKLIRQQNCYRSLNLHNFPYVNSRHKSAALNMVLNDDKEIDRFCKTLIHMISILWYDFMTLSRAAQLWQKS